MPLKASPDDSVTFHISGSVRTDSLKSSASCDRYRIHPLGLRFLPALSVNILLGACARYDPTGSRFKAQTFAFMCFVRTTLKLSLGSYAHACCHFHYLARQPSTPVDTTGFISHSFGLPPWDILLRSPITPSNRRLAVTGKVCQALKGGLVPIDSGLRLHGLPTVLHACAYRAALELNGRKMWFIRPS